jgi:hypothetical protein
MVVASEAVVTVEALSVTASRAGAIRSIDARYRVIEGLKGPPKGGKLIRVVVSCIDEPVPPGLLGYPIAERYCRGEVGLALTGVDVRRARPMPPTHVRGWTLFLTRPFGGEPWSEVPRVAFGDGCAVDDTTLSPKDRRVLQRLREMGSRGTP